MRCRVLDDILKGRIPRVASERNSCIGFSDVTVPVKI